MRRDPADSVIGSYRVVSEIGHGGMGVVYLAEHMLLGKRAAVKRLLPEASHNAELVERFFNEARAAAKIDHVGLVEVFDYGYADDGSAFIVMEYLDGESLAAKLARERRIAPQIALAIARQVSNALHAAHEHSIVHRDLKPENIFLVADPDTNGLRAKVLDFGIAKLAPAEERRSVKTKTGAVFGTPRYMSPEQCKNAARVDRRADIYALGCILHEMVLGVAPFDYDNWGELVAAHIHETPRAPRTLDPELPRSVEAIILRAIAKSPDDRYQTMADFAQDATAILNGSIDSLPAQGSWPIASRTSAVTSPAGSTKRRRWLTISAVAVVVVATSIGIYGSASLGHGRDNQVARDAGSADAREVKASPQDGSVAVLAPVLDAAEPQQVTLVVDSVPTNADVYQAADGIKLGKTPLRRMFTRTDGTADFVIRLAGYRDARVELATTANGERVVTLVRRKPLPAIPSAPPPPSGSATTGPTILDPFAH